MNNWGIVATVAFLIALGLVLRFGRTSTTLFKDFFDGTNGWFSTLSLQNFAGNTPN